MNLNLYTVKSTDCSQNHHSTGTANVNKRGHFTNKQKSFSALGCGGGGGGGHRGQHHLKCNPHKQKWLLFIYCQFPCNICNTHPTLLYNISGYFSFTVTSVTPKNDFAQISVIFFFHWLPYCIYTCSLREKQTEGPPQPPPIKLHTQNPKTC